MGKIDRELAVKTASVVLTACACDVEEQGSIITIRYNLIVRSPMLKPASALSKALLRADLWIDSVQGTRYVDDTADGALAW